MLKAIWGLLNAYGICWDKKLLQGVSIDFHICAVQTLRIKLSTEFQSRENGSILWAWHFCLWRATTHRSVKGNLLLFLWSKYHLWTEIILLRLCLINFGTYFLPSISCVQHLFPPKKMSFVPSPCCPHTHNISADLCMKTALAERYQWNRESAQYLLTSSVSFNLSLPIKDFRGLQEVYFLCRRLRVALCNYSDNYCESSSFLLACLATPRGKIYTIRETENETS